MSGSVDGRGTSEATGSPRRLQSVNELREIFEELSPDAKKSQVANHVGRFWSLLRRMEKGELVVVPLKTTGPSRLDG